MQGAGGEAGRRMPRWLRRTVAALVALVLLGGCSGGQTGQPESPGAPCEQPDLSFVRDFEGQYREPLVWEDGDGAPTSRDELVVSISLGPVPQLSAGCANAAAFVVELVVEVATRDLGTLESGTGALTFGNGDTQHATLDFRGRAINLGAIVTRSGATTELTGVLEAIENNLPGGRAVFPAP